MTVGLAARADHPVGREAKSFRPRDNEFVGK